MEGVITSENFYVDYHEIDYKKRASIATIMNYFEDISIYQSEKLGVGLKYLKDNNLAWVLYKWNIKINKYPKFGQDLEVRTIPLASRKFYAYRRFEIIDKEKNVIVTANTIWFLLDREKRKPIRISDDMKSAYGLTDVKEEPFKLPKIRVPKEYDYKKTFNIRYSDIDTNLHVNNVKYVSWFIETIPLDIVLNYDLDRLSITYEKELKYGKHVDIYTSIKDKDDKSILFTHSIENHEGKRVTAGETHWVKK
ncbi:acyl-[acyl-carrier-protein] thioesterase [Clostridium oceanicum]|uniref:Thioesterase n=1 Tax=Clostridium oceanicum TaxID=1543 RepID=A0ABP3UZB3_9CLOT